ncbi:ATP-dependent DNA helicase RecQ [Brevibacillus sp. FSL L8-0520]|uniref:RecQ family ATP-dependent DNA helicase n=1 Tax=Brevibacillus sp. FSL L8-0520 TaxID=2954689 RepID=UPI0030D4B439
MQKETLDLRLGDLLKRHFGYSSFRPGQWEIIERILRGENVLGLMATGGGKSVTYQLPALYLPGTAVVVSPLISLMTDQVQQLRGKRKIPAAYINSTMEPAETRERLFEISRGAYKLIYVSPEKLQNSAVQKALVRAGVSMLAIDEAHCISQWGHDFRTDYLRLPQVVQSLGSPPVLAVTATATPGVKAEICDLFDIKQENVITQPLNRENIAIDVILAESEADRRQMVKKSIDELQGPGIVYCSTRQTVELLVAEYQLSGKKSVHGYHGGMSSMERMVVQTQFLRGELDAIIATNAFGMGIDKSDIRFVLHYHFPPSLEAYAQEIGRVGRDGKAGYAGLYYVPEDRLIHTHLQEKEYPTTEQALRFLQGLSQAGTKPISELAMHDIPEEMAALLFFYAELAGIVSGVAAGREEYRYELSDASQMGNLAEKASQMIEAMEKPKWLKRQKLLEMLRWLEGNECYRMRLNRYFGELDHTSSAACCSHCGLDRSAYLDKSGSRTERTEKNAWNLRKALEKLLPNKKGGSIF